MARTDPRNPTGSDVVAQKLRDERRPKEEKHKKKRQGLISFEVTAEPASRHATKRASGETHNPKEHRARREEQKHRHPASSPRWKRIAVIVIVFLLLAVLFGNNYRKNVLIEDLKSANNEFAQAYETQQAQIAELKARLGGDGAGS